MVIRRDITSHSMTSVKRSNKIAGRGNYLACRARSCRVRCFIFLFFPSGFFFSSKCKTSNVELRIVDDELTCTLEKQYRASKIRYDSAAKRIAELNFYDALREISSCKKRSSSTKKEGVGKKKPDIKWQQLRIRNALRSSISH